MIVLDLELTNMTNVLPFKNDQQSISAILRKISGNLQSLAMLLEDKNNSIEAEYVHQASFNLTRVAKRLDGKSWSTQHSTALIAA